MKIGTKVESTVRVEIATGRYIRVGEALTIIETPIIGSDRYLLETRDKLEWRLHDTDFKVIENEQREKYILNRDIYDGNRDKVLVPINTVLDVTSFSPKLKRTHFNYHGTTFTCPDNWIDVVSEASVRMNNVSEILRKAMSGEKQAITYAEKRKQQPVFSGVLKYFPRALKAVANTSFVGNEQHNPGEALYWNRTKSQDNEDALVRHLIDHSIDPIDSDDGQLHLSKVAWRALAALEKYLEDEELSAKQDK